MNNTERLFKEAKKRTEIIDAYRENGRKNKDGNYSVTGIVGGEREIKKLFNDAIHAVEQIGKINKEDFEKVWVDLKDICETVMEEVDGGEYSYFRINEKETGLSIKITNYECAKLLSALNNISLPEEDKDGRSKLLDIKINVLDAMENAYTLRNEYKNDYYTYLTYDNLRESDKRFLDECYKVIEEAAKLGTIDIKTIAPKNVKSMFLWLDKEKRNNLLNVATGKQKGAIKSYIASANRAKAAFRIKEAGSTIKEHWFLTICLPMIATLALGGLHHIGFVISKSIKDKNNIIKIERNIEDTANFAKFSESAIVATQDENGYYVEILGNAIKNAGDTPEFCSVVYEIDKDLYDQIYKYYKISYEYGRDGHIVGAENDLRTNIQAFGFTKAQRADWAVTAELVEATTATPVSVNYHNSSLTEESDYNIDME